MDSIYGEVSVIGLRCNAKSAEIARRLGFDKRIDVVDGMADDQWDLLVMADPPEIAPHLSMTIGFQNPKGYSPLRRWLRRERAAEHAAMLAEESRRGPYIGTVTVECDPTWGADGEPFKPSPGHPLDETWPQPLHPNKDR